MPRNKIIILSGITILYIATMQAGTLKFHNQGTLNNIQQEIYNSTKYISEFDKFKQEVPKKVVAVSVPKQSSTVSRGESIPINKDYLLIARVIHLEAQGESLEGKIAVGAVILNRVKDPRFPDTVEEVIFQRGQFSSVSSQLYRVKPSEECFKATEEALKGNDPTQGALFFWNPRKVKLNRKVVIKIGNHAFAK